MRYFVEIINDIYMGKIYHVHSSKDFVVDQLSSDMVAVYQVESPTKKSAVAHLLYDLATNKAKKVY